LSLGTGRVSTGRTFARMAYRSLDPLALPVPERHQLLLGTVAPRPIAFASTVDAEGRPNLAPFSFFNVFSSNPPTLVFSPARGGRDGKLKDTLLNVREVPEVVINVVAHDMVQQMSLASTAWERGVNEFEKAGFTALASETMRPFRVAESPAQFECAVTQVIELGQQGGAGNLIVAEVRRMHLAERIFGPDGRIDPQRIDLVARMGGDWYARASGAAVFEVEKPVARLGVGIDALPEGIRHSPWLTGNHLGQLGNVEAIPGAEAAEAVRGSAPADAGRETLHRLAAEALDAGAVDRAWGLLRVGAGAAVGGAPAPDRPRPTFS
jgi:flavin reductase (DIM6/NTAB) family NADH-FMN oxidoreductase RutF